MGKSRAYLTSVFVNRADYRIRLGDFSPLRGINYVRIASGAFLIPHAMNLFADGGFAPGGVAFAARAGFHPPELWVLLAAISDVILGVALVLGFCTRLAALGAGAMLLLGAYAIQQVMGDAWIWSDGGYEYKLFGAICCLAVAIEAWKAWAKERRAAG